MLRIESRETVHFEAKLARGGLPFDLKVSVTWIMT